MKSGSILALGAFALAAGTMAAPAKKNWLLTFSVTDKGAHVM
eukprot:gene37826-61202_t